MALRASSPYFRYGAPALYTKLGALPSRRQAEPPFAIDPPTNERIRVECAIVDDWAIELFRFCYRRSSAALRMNAMLIEVERSLEPADANLRIGLFPTVEACHRVMMWRRLAMRLPVI
jgi:hypothetical protein